jgi:hypothetical protein
MKTIKSLLKFILGITLLFIAVVSIKYTFIFGIVSILVAYTYKKRFIKGLGKIGNIFIAAAYCIDVLGCVILQVPLNILFTKPTGHKFGSKYETISYVLGKNQIAGTLTLLGKGLVKFLDFLDKNHCIKTVEHYDNMK